MIDVSIIVPVYNVEEYLDRCINSLIKQTLNNIEIILVDDGSLDRSSSKCDLWATKDSRIKVIHKQNEGLGLACNTGLDMATGKYVAFVDSDDWVDINMYETLLNTAENYNAQMVFCGIRRVNNSGETNIMYQAKELNVYNTKETLNSYALNMIAATPQEKTDREIPMSAKIVLYNRKHIETHNIRFESERKYISEDLLFNLDNIYKANCIIEMPQTFYNYYVNNSSLSQTIRLDRFEKAQDMRNELLKRYANGSEDFKIRVDRMFIGYSRVAINQICTTSKLTLLKKYKLIKQICRNKIWLTIKNTYPIQIMPLKHRIFLQNIIWQNSILLIIIIKFNKLL